MKDKAIEKYKREQMLIKIELLLDEIKEIYGQLRFLEDSRREGFYKTELSLHKLKHFRMVSDLYMKLEGKNLKPLPLLYKKEGTLKEIYKSEISLLEEVQGMLRDLNLEGEKDLLGDLVMDQQIYLFKLLSASL